MLGLALAVFLVFSGCLSNGFVGFDDNEYVYENPNVTGGLTSSAVVWALTTVSYFYWQPVTWLSHMLDCELFGLNPAGHHFTNLLLHSLNAVVFLLAVFRLTGDRNRSLVATALFAVHPLRVESVAWIAERKDLLGGLFFLLGILAYESYARRRSRGSYAAVIACYFLALAAKPTAITFPFVLLLLDYWPLSRLRPVSVILREKLPLFALTIGSAVLTYVGQKEAGAIVAREVVPLGLRLSNAAIAYWRYLAKLVIPLPLGAFYPYEASIPIWQALIAAAGLAAVSFLFLRIKDKPYLLMGWLWFLGAAVPMIGIVQAGLQSHADRFTYIPMMGLAIALVWLAGDVLSSQLLKKWGTVALLLILAGCSWHQVGYWENGLTLFSHTLAITKDNPLIESHYAVALQKAGRVDEALPHAEAAVKLSPRFVSAWLLLGSIYADKKNPEAAERAYREAVRLQPSSGRAHMFVGMSAMVKGDLNNAWQEYTEALKYPLSPEHAANVYNDMGLILIKQGKGAEAVDQFRAALQQRPDLVPAHLNVVNALLDQNRLDEALRHLNYAIIATKGNPELRRMLAALQASQR